MNAWTSVFAAAVLSFLFANSEVIFENDRPVIGILTQELLPSIKKRYPGYKSYIAGSYVKAVQASGARVVPIFTGQHEYYYKEMVHRVNGVLYPGGDVDFSVKGGYAEAGKFVYKWAIKANQQGDHFPLYGVCLGLEFIFHLSNDEHNLLTSCYDRNRSIPLDFKPGFRNSRLFQSAPDYVINILQSQPVTIHWHVECVTEANITKFKLDKVWNVLTLNEDIHGLEYVSTAEMREYPIFVVQYHPEKNAYEWKKEASYPHSFNAIYSVRYFYDYFINESRHNFHYYPEELLVKDSIDNYTPVFSGKHKDQHFDQLYLFK